MTRCALVTAAMPLRIASATVVASFEVPDAVGGADVVPLPPEDVHPATSRAVAANTTRSRITAPTLQRATARAGSRLSGYQIESGALKDRHMVFGKMRLSASLAAASLIACACSSSTSGPPPSSSPPTSASSGGAGDSAVQTYLDAVNRLCGALLPKVIAVTHGGSLDVPVKKYFAQRPAHAKLLSEFDHQVAQVPVPSAAKAKAATFAAYVQFANRLDAKRYAAARRGEAAYAKEIKSEASIESDPAITALISAGFDQSCEAR